MPKKKAAQISKKESSAYFEGSASWLPGLQDFCIRLIARNIHDIEALGNIGLVNMDKICQIISKNRSLDNETIQLFLDGSLRNLHLYDCSKIDPHHLQMIATFCPLLESLSLISCGRLNNKVIDHYITHLPNLTTLEFRGAFLVTVPTWKNLFRSLGRKLAKLTLSDTARLDHGMIQSLSSECTSLDYLSLSNILTMNDDAVRHLGVLQNLTSLEISFPGDTVTDKSIVTVLESAGAQLKHLTLDGCGELTSRFFIDGVCRYCSRLNYLSLARLESTEFSSEGLSIGFSNWKCPGLESLSLMRCVNIGEVGVAAVLRHSGHSLVKLNLNSLDSLTIETFALLESMRLPRLETLDVSWIRCLNDGLVSALLESCGSLKTLYVFGINHVTQWVTSPSVRIVGREDF